MEKVGKLNAYWHDGILTSKSLSLDVMVMEGKGDKKSGVSDIEKLGKVLSKNLCLAMDKILDVDRPHIRMHGLHFVGCSVDFLEARLDKTTGHILIYSVGHCDISKCVEGFGVIAGTIKMFVGFKQRIERNIQRILDANVKQGIIDTSTEQFE